MAEQEIVHVAIAPPDTLDADLVGKVATIVNKGIYDTRLLLAGGFPKIVAHCQSLQAAESITQSLRDVGLVAIVCRDTELHKRSQILSAHTLEFGTGEVLFRDKNGQVVRKRASDVFLILKGRRQTQLETEVTTTKMKFSLGATALMGGIPIWRRVRDKNRDVSFETEFFARLYDWKPTEPCVEILQHAINYSFVGEQMAVSSLTNFNTVVEKLKGVFPQAAFDNSLEKTLQTAVPSTSVQEKLEIDCKLIYLCRLAAHGLSTFK